MATLYTYACCTVCRRWWNVSGIGNIMDLPRPVTCGALGGRCLNARGEGD